MLPPTQIIRWFPFPYQECPDRHNALGTGWGPNLDPEGVGVWGVQADAQCLCLRYGYC